MKKHKFGFIEPNQIMTVIVCLIFISVGIFAIATVDNTQNRLGIGTGYDGSFAVTDTSIDQTCDTGEHGLTGMNVMYYNGNNWFTIDSGNYTYSGTVVTVDYTVLR